MGIGNCSEECKKEEEGLEVRKGFLEEVLIDVSQPALRTMIHKLFCM